MSENSILLHQLLHLHLHLTGCRSTMLPADGWASELYPFDKVTVGSHAYDVG